MHRRLTLLVMLGALLVMPSAASGQGADIEGVWSFSGGQVVVKAQPDGTFLGTVIRATTFANCPHRPGEEMWTGVRRQPDGQYWGGHQWYNNADCSPTPGRGNTAFRVLSRPDGATFLRVCFAAPERPDLQPTIAPDGTSANTTTACDDSDLVSPLPTAEPKITSVATLPKQGKRKCLSRRSFRIRLKEPRGDALESAVVYLRGKVVARRSGARLTAPIILRNLPRGRYTVRIVAKTVLGRTMKGSRRYRTCVPSTRRGT